MLMASLFRSCRFMSKTFAHANSRHFGAKMMKIQPVAPACSGNDDVRNDVIAEIFKQKDAKQLSIDDIASKLGYTNLYTAQVLSLKAPLNPAKKDVLGKVLDLPQSTLDEMTKCGLRRFDEQTVQEPAIYRLTETVNHYGESIKMLINEKCGDGIPSAIDMYCDFDVRKGKKGEDRIVLTFDMKYLEFTEQNNEGKTDK